MADVVIEGGARAGDAVQVRVDQDRCTGDGLCVQYAPEVFEFDIDGLAYVKGADGELATEPGAKVDVPEHLRLDVIDAASECPGECIYVSRSDGSLVAGGPSGGATTDGSGASPSAA